MYASQAIEQPIKDIWVKPEMALSPILDTTLGHQNGVNIDASFFNS